jgi:cold shock CspA family protein
VLKMTRRLAGTVKRFSELEDYGYIRPDDSTKEVIFHRASVVDIEPLREGQRVSYELLSTKHGQSIANNVRVQTTARSRPTERAGR